MQRTRSRNLRCAPSRCGPSAWRQGWRQPHPAKRAPHRANPREARPAAGSGEAAWAPGESTQAQAVAAESEAAEAPGESVQADSASTEPVRVALADAATSKAAAPSGPRRPCRDRSEPDRQCFSKHGLDTPAAASAASCAAAATTTAAERAELAVQVRRDDGTDSRIARPRSSPRGMPCTSSRSVTSSTACIGSNRFHRHRSSSPFCR